MRPGAGPEGTRTTDLLLPRVSIHDADGHEVGVERHRPGVTTRIDSNLVYSERDGLGRLTFLMMPGSTPAGKSGTAGHDSIRLTYEGDRMQPSSATDNHGYIMRATNDGQNQIRVDHRAGIVSMTSEVSDLAALSNSGSARGAFAVRAEWNALAGSRTQRYPEIGHREVTHYQSNSEGGIANPLPSTTTTTYDDNAGGVQVSTRVSREDRFGTMTFGDPRNVPERPLGGPPLVPPLGTPFQPAQTRYPPGTIITFTDGSGQPHRVDVAQLSYSTRNNQPVVYVSSRDGREYQAAGVIAPQQEIRHGVENRTPVLVASWHNVEVKNRILQAAAVAPAGAPAQPGQIAPAQPGR